MLSDVMEHFGLSKSFGQVTDFETDHHRQLLKDLKIAIHEGGLIALTGDCWQWQNGAPGSPARAVAGRGQTRGLRDDGNLHNRLLAAQVFLWEFTCHQSLATGDGVKEKAESIVMHG